jgi:hypothetical protein
MESPPWYSFVRVVHAAGQRVCFCTEPVVAGPLWLSSTVNRDSPQRSATVERLSRGTNSARLDLEAFRERSGGGGGGGGG